MPKPVRTHQTRIAKPKHPPVNPKTGAQRASAGSPDEVMTVHPPAKALRELALKAAKARWSQAQSAAARGHK